MFFSALATIKLADASAIFVVAPLIITALSAVILQERVGIRRWSVLIIGMASVILITKLGSIFFLNGLYYFP